jgi:hypothetical protein
MTALSLNSEHNCGKRSSSYTDLSVMVSLLKCDEPFWYQSRSYAMSGKNKRKEKLINYLDMRGVPFDSARNKN